MPKRRILWYPLRGIDKTLPKSMESTSAAQLSDSVVHAVDGLEISTYNSRNLVTRRDLKSVFGTDYGSVFALLKYTRGLAVAGSAGIYLDSSLRKSISLSAFTYLASWYKSLYWSTGSSWGYFGEDDHNYILGIDPPGSGNAANFISLYTYTGTTGRWTGPAMTLIDWNATFTDAMVGQYIQIYNVTQDTCFTGTVAARLLDTEISVAVDLDTANPAPDVIGGDIYWYISPNRWLTFAEYKNQGGYDIPTTYPPVVIKYKTRFRRSRDGASSNSTTHGSAITTGTFEGCHISNTLVGGLRVTLSGITTSVDPDVDEVEIYRLDFSVTNTDLYRLVGTVALGTTTFDDEVQMYSGLAAMDSDYKYPCPHVLSNLLFYGSRLWGTYQNRLYYSEPYGDEEKFQYFGEIGLNYFEFVDTIKTILDNNRTMLVLLDRETWILEGLNPNTMNKRRLNSDIGTYSATSATVYKGGTFTVAADLRFYQIAGADWSEVPQITSLLPASPSYVHLVGSDNCVWISTGSQVVRYELSNQDCWIYSLKGRMASGSHTTYLGQTGKVYEVDAVGGSEATPAAFIESPDIYIGSGDGHRGRLSRILFRTNCASGNINIYIDGVLWKTVRFSTVGEQTVIKHFWPVQGYFAKIRIEANQYNELTLSGPIILNPF
jgi:hypothetical protein